jgi:hypothetical protein
LGRVLGIALILVTSLALGLGSTLWIVTRGVEIGALRSGPWLADLRAATDPDPYTRARQAYTGAVALVLAEGLHLTARMDDTGQALRSNCRYRISGNVPKNRYWTLTLTTIDGEPLNVPARRAGFTSSELLRDEDGSWQIIASPTARAGNWLPLPGNLPFVLVLNLYEPSILGGTASISRDQLPHIEREDCL